MRVENRVSYENGIVIIKTISLALLIAVRWMYFFYVYIINPSWTLVVDGPNENSTRFIQKYVGSRVYFANPF